MIGEALLIGFFLFMVWWVMHPTVFEKRWAEEDKKTLILDRKARFMEYLVGEHQLMLEWEEAFDPKGNALAKELREASQRMKDQAWLFGSPYRAISTGVYADRKDYRCFDGWSQTFPCTAEEFNKQRMAA